MKIRTRIHVSWYSSRRLVGFECFFLLAIGSKFRNGLTRSTLKLWHWKHIQKHMAHKKRRYLFFILF